MDFRRQHLSLRPEHVHYLPDHENRGSHHLYGWCLPLLDMELSTPQNSKLAVPRLLLTIFLQMSISFEKKSQQIDLIWIVK